MDEGEFQRARQPEQRAARKANILDTARTIAASGGAMHITISELGRRANLTKASIYRYFDSLEHVLLSLLASELDELSSECDGSLTDADLSVEEVASRLAAAYVRRPLLCELLGMVSPILEHNVSADAVASAKLDVLRASERLAQATARAVPGLSVHDARWASHSVALYVAGAWPAAHPSKVAAEVLSRAEFQSFQLHFEDELPKLILVILRGVVQP